MFGRVTITLGIGPHSSFIYFTHVRLRSVGRILNIKLNGTELKMKPAFSFVCANYSSKLTLNQIRIIMTMIIIKITLIVFLRSHKVVNSS